MAVSIGARFGRARLPVMLQSEASECGLICLAMLAAYHGNRDGHTRTAPSARRHGARLVVAHADRRRRNARFFGARAARRNRRSAPRRLSRDPALGFRSLRRAEARRRPPRDHPQPGGRRAAVSARTNCPDTSPASRSNSRRRAAFERTAPPPRLGLWTFWRDAEGLGRPIVQLLVLSTLIQLFALATPSYMQVVVDDVLVKQDVDVLNVLAIGFALLALINVATKALRGWVSLYLANQLNFSIGVRLFFHLIRLPLDYFQRRHVGDVVSRFRSLKPVQEFITGGVVAAVIDGAMALTTLIVIFVYSPLPRRHRARRVRRVRRAARAAVSAAAPAQSGSDRRRRQTRLELPRNDPHAAGHQAVRQRIRTRTRVAGPVRRVAERRRPRRPAEPRLRRIERHAARHRKRIDRVRRRAAGVVRRVDDRHVVRVHRVSNAFFERDEFVDRARSCRPDARAAPRTDCRHRARRTGTGLDRANRRSLRRCAARCRSSALCFAYSRDDRAADSRSGHAHRTRAADRDRRAVRRRQVDADAADARPDPAHVRLHRNGRHSDRTFRHPRPIAPASPRCCRTMRCCRDRFATTSASSISASTRRNSNAR